MLLVEPMVREWGVGNPAPMHRANQAYMVPNNMQWWAHPAACRRLNNTFTVAELVRWELRADCGADDARVHAGVVVGSQCPCFRPNTGAASQRESASIDCTWVGTVGNEPKLNRILSALQHNQQCALLLAADRLYFFCEGDGHRGRSWLWSDVERLCDVDWEIIEVPAAYVAENWPIEVCALSCRETRVLPPPLAAVNGGHRVPLTLGFVATRSTRAWTVRWSRWRWRDGRGLLSST